MTWRTNAQSITVTGMPADQTALGTKATTSDWDANTEIAITAKSQFLHVYTDEDVFLICTDSTDDPSTNPTLYPKYWTHEIPCRHKGYLHYKNEATNTGNIYVTAFHD